MCTCAHRHTHTQLFPVLLSLLLSCPPLSSSSSGIFSPSLLSTPPFHSSFPLLLSTPLLTSSHVLCSSHVLSSPLLFSRTLLSRSQNGVKRSRTEKKGGSGTSQCLLRRRSAHPHAQTRGLPLAPSAPLLTQSLSLTWSYTQTLALSLKHTLSHART